MLMFPYTKFNQPGERCSPWQTKPPGERLPHQWHYQMWKLRSGRWGDAAIRVRAEVF